MITAVDTSVLLDVLGADPTFGPASRGSLRDSLARGSLLACEVVWAEVVAFFPGTDEARTALDRLQIGFSALGADEAVAAGAAWKVYRGRGGTRHRVIADFLIGAHARSRADRLCTRDRGFYRTCFGGLEILDPTP